MGATALAYQEAPMLRVKVAAGELPPVEERLPLEPKVLSAERNEIANENLDFEIGQYGGMLRTVGIDPAFNGDLGYAAQNEPLVSAPRGIGQKIEGNLLEDFSVSEDGKVFTFHLRKGLKWSDGHPVTTEDVLFNFEDVILNEEIMPVPPYNYTHGMIAGGEPMELEIIDEYTFRMSFAVPYGGFIDWLADMGQSWANIMKPKHYLSQFHARYTPLEELEPLIKEAGLSEGEWWTLFNQKDFYPGRENGRVGYPVLSPWMMVDRTKEGTTIYERNPYYFKVDAEGNQLPYVDRLRVEVVGDVEMITMKILAGEVDIQRDYIGIDNVALYKEREAAGGYRTVLLSGGGGSPAGVYLNQTYEDPVWREIVGDVRFRQALSMGINREEVLDAVYFGYASLPGTEYTEYDPAKSNQLLDEMGLDKRDAEGWRLGPDGNPVLIPILSPPWSSDYANLGELLIEYWKALGIKATFKSIETGLIVTYLTGNELQGSIIMTHSAMEKRLDPVIAAPLFTMEWWAYLWDKWWRTDGEQGEEPPQVVKRMLELGDIIVTTPSLEDRQKALDELISMETGNRFWIPGVIGVQTPVIASEKLGNVPHGGLNKYPCISAEQLFYKQ